MGIKVSEGGAGAVFFKINAKEGCLVEGSGANKHKYEPGRAALEGTLIGLSTKHEIFEGDHSDTVKLVLADKEAGKPNMHVTFTIATGGDDEVEGDASAFGLRLLGRLNAIDVGQPIEIRPWHVEAGGKIGDTVFESAYAGCSVKQNGQSVTEDYGNGVTTLPGLEKHKIGNREVADKTPWNDLLASTLQQVAAKIPQRGQQHQQASTVAEGIDPTEAVAAAEAAAASAPAAAAPTRESFRARA